MAQNNDTWNGYYDFYSFEPKDASQLQKFSNMKSNKYQKLSFKDANALYKANKGKGKISGGDSGGSAAAAETTDAKPQATTDGGGDGAGLYGQINQGLSVTSGLKKVTSDMKTKNQKNRSGKVAAKKPAAKKEQAAPAKPPSIKKKGPRLWVENYTEGVEELKQADVRTEIYFVNCKNTGFQIPGKVKAVILDGCQKLQVEINEVVSAVEMINCKGCKLYLKECIPTVNIDKCTDPKLIIFKNALDKKPSIITSMTSDMNIEFPGETENDDWKEVAIPYQFITKVDPETKEVTTVAVAHSG